METYTLSKEWIDRIVSLVDEFDDGNEDCYEAAAELVTMLAEEIKSKSNNNMNKHDFINDEIILCNNNNPEDGVVSHLFDDDDEHCYDGKFYDGIAVLHKDPEDEGVPENVVVTYPTMEVVKGNADLAQEIREYAGLSAEDDINYFDIALKYGQCYIPSEIELPF